MAIMRSIATGAHQAGGALAALCLSAALTLQAQDWHEDPALQARLRAGEVIVQEASIDPVHPRGSVRAAVLVHATPDAVWRLVTDCREASTFVPGLTLCRRVAASADGRWEDIEQEVHYSWLLPSVRYVFRAQYDRPHRIDFHRLRGDLRAEEGSWRLSEIPNGGGTLVEYEMYLDPGFWVPQFLVRRTLRSDLPDALSALKTRLEAAPVGPRSSAGP
jgi:hypothetical protein